MENDIDTGTPLPALPNSTVAAPPTTKKYKKPKEKRYAYFQEHGIPKLTAQAIQRRQAITKTQQQAVEQLERRYFKRYCFAVEVVRGASLAEAWINAGLPPCGNIPLAAARLQKDKEVQKIIEALRTHVQRITKITPTLLMNKMWEIVRRCTENPREKSFQCAIAAGSVIERILVAQTKHRHVIDFEGLNFINKMPTGQLIDFVQKLDTRMQEAKKNAIPVAARIIESTPN